MANALVLIIITTPHFHWLHTHTCCCQLGFVFRIPSLMTYSRLGPRFHMKKALIGSPGNCLQVGPGLLLKNSLTLICRVCHRALHARLRQSLPAYQSTPSGRRNLPFWTCTSRLLQLFPTHPGRLLSNCPLTTAMTDVWSPVILTRHRIVQPPLFHASCNLYLVFVLNIRDVSQDYMMEPLHSFSVTFWDNSEQCRRGCFHFLN